MNRKHKNSKDSVVGQPHHKLPLYRLIRTWKLDALQVSGDMLNYLLTVAWTIDYLYGK